MPESLVEENLTAEWMAVVLRGWRVLLVFGIAGTALVVGAALAIKAPFKSEFSFTPQSGGAASGLAGIAAQFGVEVSAADGGQSPDFYLELLRSGPVLTGVVADLEARFGSAVLSDEIGASGDNDLQLRVDATRILNEQVVVTLARRAGIVRVEVSFGDSTIAFAIAESLLRQVQRFENESRMTRGGAERAFAEHRLEEVREVLAARERELGAFLVTNREFRSSPQLVFEHDRLARAVALQSGILTALEQSAERARLEEVRDTPLIVIVEPPYLPVEREERPWILLVLGGHVLGMAVGACVLLRTRIVDQWL